MTIAVDLGCKAIKQTNKQTNKQKCMQNHPKHKNVNCYCSISKLLTLLRPMEFSIKFDTFRSGWSIVYIKSGWSIVYPGYNFHKDIISCIMQHFIWVFTICQSTHRGFCLQRVKYGCQEFFFVLGLKFGPIPNGI